MASPERPAPRAQRNRRATAAAAALRTAADLAPSADAPEAVDRILSTLREACRAARVGCFEPVKAGEGLRLRAGSGWPPDTAGSVETAGDGRSVIERAFVSGRTAVAYGLDATADLPEAGARGALAVPVRRRERAEGVVAVFRASRERFGEDEIRAAEAAARLVAAAGWMSDAAAAPAGSLATVAAETGPQALARAVAERLQELFRVPAVGIFRLDEPTGDLVLLVSRGERLDQQVDRIVHPRGTAAVGVAVATRAPVVSPNVLQDPRLTFAPAMRALVEASPLRASLALPLLVGGRVIGALALMDLPGRTFTPEEVRMAEGHAVWAALSLEHGRLHVGLTRGSERLAALAEAAAALSGSLDPAVVARRFVDVVRDLLGAPGAILYEVAGPAAERRVLAVSGASAPGEAAGAVLAVPLIVQERTVGALEVIDRPGRVFGEQDVSLVLALASQAAVGLDNARLYEAAAVRADRLRTLARMQRLISSALELPTLLDELARATAELLHVPLASFWVPGPDGQMLEGRTHYGGPPVAGGPAAVRWRRVGEGLVGWIALHRAALTVDDRFADPRSVEVEPLARAGLRCFHGEPVPVEGEVSGVLSLAAREPVRLTADDRELLDMLIAQAATAIRNARLYGAAARRQREAEALAEVAGGAAVTLELRAVAGRLTEGLQRLLAVQGCALLAPGPSAEDLAVLAVSGAIDVARGHTIARTPDTLVGLAAVERTVAWTPDFLRDPRLRLSPEARARLERSPYRVGLAVPLLVQDRMIGVLAVVDTEGRRFDEQDLLLARAFADQAALALENARLFEETEQRRLEAETAGRRFLDLVEGLDAIVWEREVPTGRLSFMSHRVEPVLGRSAGAWMEESALWDGRAHEEDRERLAAFERAALAGQSTEGLEYRALAADGRVVWLRDRLQVVRDAAGTPQRVRGLSVDLTGLKALEAQLLQAQKMEAIGRLAGGIAHDFNNLLTVITGRAEMVLRALGPDDRSTREVALVKQAADRAAILTAQLLAFSRKQVLRPQVVDLGRILERAQTLLERLVGEDVTFATAWAATGRVLADPGQLEQVIVNLVVNARDAMPRGGIVTIETHDVVLGEAEAARIGRAPGAWVSLRVGDTGVGMTAEVQARIFEPFFTTKEPGRGTGLGLAMVYGVIMQSGGHVAVESEPGRGTTFTILLPRAVDTGAPGPALPATALARGSGRVLLVEDDHEVRALALEVLAEAGYTVVEARDGEEALAIARAAPAFDLIVTDVVMPRMTGRELAERLDAGRSGPPVLYMSGYIDEAITGQNVDPLGHFLPKPFMPAALLRKVQEALQR